MGNYDHELYHYGVKGMKWGVKKDPQKAYEKASAKLQKLDAKVEKQAARAERKAARADASMASIFASRKNKRRAVQRAMTSARNYRRRLEKADRWYKAMESTFKGTKVSLTKEQQALGKKYADAKRMRMLMLY